MNLAYERSDWLPTAAAKALIRSNGPLLAYIGGKPTRFTSKDHNFLPGETVEKQLILINNSRATVTADCEWSLDLPRRDRDQAHRSANLPDAAGEIGKHSVLARLPECGHG